MPNAASSINIPDHLQRMPASLYNFADQNEDASVELLVLEALSERLGRPLRVLVVGSCGTNALTTAASLHVEWVDATDSLQSQIMLCELIRAAADEFSTPEELASFIDASGNEETRARQYPKVREHLSEEARVYWDENRATVELGIMPCGGLQRCYALFRSQLPSTDPAALTKDPEAVGRALRDSMTLEFMETYMVNMPMPAIVGFVEHALPAITRALNQRLTQLGEGADPDFVVQSMLECTFPMNPVSSRPVFLRPETFEGLKRHGCGPGRLDFHVGPLQVLGPKLAQERGGYDLVDMSNILDMVTPDVAPSIVTAMMEAVRPGGAILCRWSKQPGFLGTTFTGCGLEVDGDLSRRATEAETSCFMSDVCVGFV